jgi:HEAT repeat protein
VRFGSGTWALLLAATLARAAAADDPDCGACSAKALCAAHKEVEKAAVEAFRAAYKDKDPARRLAALRALGEVNRGHVHARSRVAAQAMAVALKDPELEVRAQAATLIGGTQEPTTALKALAATLDPLLGRVEKLDLKKARGTREYTQDLLWLRALYEGLQAVGARESAPLFVRGLEMMNAEVVQAAARTCGFLKTRTVIDALVDALEHLANAEASAETGNAWIDVCKRMPESTGHTGIRPQVDANDAPRFARDWAEWWKTNRTRREFD